MDNVGKQIAAANKAVDAETFARIIFAALFETGPSRLDAKDSYLAKTAIRAAAMEWEMQLLASAGRDVDKWKTAFKDTKRELDELKLQVAIWKKEGKL